MVLVVLADAREVDERGDTGSLDHGGLADARELEEARTLDGAGGQDDLLGSRDGLAVGQSYSGRLVAAAALGQVDLSHLSVGLDHQVAASQGQIAVSRVRAGVPRLVNVGGLHHDADGRAVHAVVVVDVDA